MVKLSVFLTRRSDLTHEEFSRYWVKEHATLLQCLPEVRQFVCRYVQQDAVSGLPDGLPIAPFDGVAELWFDNLEAAAAAMSSASYATVVADDEEKFLDRSRPLLMVSEERTGIWAGK